MNSSSPHLYSDLDIPVGSKGRLPRAQQTREGLGAEVLEDLGETGKGAGRRGPSGGDRGRGDSRTRGGDRTRGDSRGGEARSDSSRPASRDATPPTDGAERPRRSRNRRRTRGGSPSGDTAS